MIKNKNILFILLLSSVLNVNLKAETTTTSKQTTAGDNKYSAEYLNQNKEDFIKQNGNLKVGDLNISGLKKTQKRVVTNTIKLNDEVTLEEFNSYLAVNNLQKKGIFSDIDLNYSKNPKGEADINLHIEDKWTLIPIPMMSSSGSSSSVGLMLFETNFLGLQKALAVGGSYASNGSSLVVAYADPNVLDTNFIFQLATAIASSTLESKTLKSDVLYQEYKASAKVVNVMFGYEFSDNFKLATQGVYTKVLIDDGYTESFNKIDDYEKIDYGLVASIDFQNYEEYLNYGFYFETNVKNSILSSYDFNENFNFTSAKASYSIKALKHSRLKLDLGAGVGETPFIVQDRKGGQTGFMSLPSDTLPIKNYANYTITMEHPLYKQPWGLVTFSYFWEQGTLNGGLNEDLSDNTSYTNYYAPGVGVQMYLKDLALPAMGFTYAQNMVTNEGSFKLTIGLSI